MESFPNPLAELLLERLVEAFAEKQEVIFVLLSDKP